jgi:3-deoxy-D-manno-octulosonate 8-phosphate phosphatase KdsC-like HAD superfamily phosphatase
MRVVGLAFAVGDAHPEARRAAHVVTLNAGGAGAVREVCDYLLAARIHERSVSERAPAAARRRPAR